MFKNLISKFKNISELNWCHHVLIFGICFLFIISRRIDVVLYSQFWAEDGAVWFAQAYNLGILKSFFLPHTGYLQTFSRIIASFSQFLPLVWVPLFYNLSAIFIKILPINFLLSGRFSHVSKKYSPFVLLSFVYLMLPNTTEVFANVTNTHWYLSLLAFMVIVAKPTKTWLGKFFDIFIITLSSFSGPFVILLLPLAFIYWYKKRYKEKLVVLILLTFFSLLQGLLIFLTASGVRSSMDLGFSLGFLIKIISGQIFTASIFGFNGFANLYNLFLYKMDFLSKFVYLIIFLFGLFSLGFTLLKAKLEIKLFLVFSFLVLSASLFSPMVSVTELQWQVMSLPGAATRYWFIPMLGFVVSIFYLAFQKKYKFARFLGFSVIIIMSIGIMWDWVIPSWKNFNFSNQVEEFSHVEVGEEYSFFIQPEGWQMKLIKK